MKFRIIEAPNQVIGEFVADEVADNGFLAALCQAAKTSGSATATDPEGCQVTATLQGREHFPLLPQIFANPDSLSDDEAAWAVTVVHACQGEELDAIYKAVQGSPWTVRETLANWAAANRPGDYEVLDYASGGYIREASTEDVARHLMSATGPERVLNGEFLS